MDFEADIISPSRNRELEKKIALDTLDWIFEWNMAAHEFTGEPHSRQGLYNLYRHFNDAIDYAFYSVDPDIARKAGFIMTAHSIEKDTQKLRALYHGAVTSDTFEERFHNNLCQIVAQDSEARTRPLTGQKISRTQEGENTCFSSELFVRTGPLYHVADKPVPNPNDQWFERQFVAYREIGNLTMDITPLSSCSIEAIPDRYSVFDDIRIPHCRAEELIPTETLHQLAWIDAHVGLKHASLPGHMVAINDLMHVNFSILEEQDKLYPHLENDPDSFLFQFHPKLFEEKALAEAKFRLAFFGDDKPLKELVEPYLARKEKLGKAVLGIPNIVSYDLG